MILKLWRGQYGLAKTYWLFGVLGGFLANVVVTASAGALRAAMSGVVKPADIEGSIMALGLAVVLVLCLSGLYAMVVSVGVVRAGRAYTGFRLWAWLATLAVVVGWLLVLLIVLVMIIEFG